MGKPWSEGARDRYMSGDFQENQTFSRNNVGGILYAGYMAKFYDENENNDELSNKAWKAAKALVAAELKAAGVYYDDDESITDNFVNFFEKITGGVIDDDFSPTFHGFVKRLHKNVANHGPEKGLRESMSQVLDEWAPYRVALELYPDGTKSEAVLAYVLKKDTETAWDIVYDTNSRVGVEKLAGERLAELLMIADFQEELSPKALEILPGVYDLLKAGELKKGMNQLLEVINENYEENLGDSSSVPALFLGFKDNVDIFLDNITLKNYISVTSDLVDYINAIVRIAFEAEYYFDCMRGHLSYLINAHPIPTAVELSQEFHDKLAKWCDNVETGDCE